MIVHAKVGKDAPPVVSPYPPTPQNEMYFYINDRIKMQQHLKAVRIGFQPGGLHRLLGYPMCRMIDESLDAADVFGNEIGDLNDRLQEATHFDVIKDIIEQFLLQKAKKLKSILPFDKAMLELMKYDGNISIEKIASLACVSLRQFERLSKERIGFPPKLFARLIRFSKAYRLREDFPDWSWTRIAYECNYFDQMHFIRDFKQFAEVTPGRIEKELEQTPFRMQTGRRF